MENGAVEAFDKIGGGRCTYLILLMIKKTVASLV